MFFFLKKNDLLYCYDISLENFTESTFFTFFPPYDGQFEAIWQLFT